jgi:hypothetical protein
VIYWRVNSLQLTKTNRENINVKYNIIQLFNGCGCNRPNYLSWGAGNDQVLYCMRHIFRYVCVFFSPVIYWRVNSLQETIARQTIELTFEPFFHWTKNFKTSKISKISYENFEFFWNLKFLNILKFSHFLKILNFKYFFYFFFILEFWNFLKIWEILKYFEILEIFEKALRKYILRYNKSIYYLIVNFFLFIK